MHWSPILPSNSIYVLVCIPCVQLNACAWFMIKWPECCHLLNYFLGQPRNFFPRIHNLYEMGSIKDLILLPHKLKIKHDQTVPIDNPPATKIQNRMFIGRRSGGFRLGRMEHPLTISIVSRGWCLQLFGTYEWICRHQWIVTNFAVK